MQRTMHVSSEPPRADGDALTTPTLHEYLAYPPHRLPDGVEDAAAHLEQQLGALAAAMDDLDRIATQVGYSPYLHQVRAERARYQRLRELTEPLPVLIDSLLTPGCVHLMLQLLAPSLVFPAATPMQIDFSGEMLHRARQTAELHKENLRKLISSASRRFSLDTAAADEGKCSGDDSATQGLIWP